MNTLVLPVAVIMILAVTSQLYVIAEQSSDKAVLFADDMNNAMDCAVRGIDIKECVPGIYDADFREDIENFSKVLDELTKSSNDVYLTVPINRTLMIKSGDDTAFLKLIDSSRESADFIFLRYDGTMQGEEIKIDKGMKHNISLDRYSYSMIEVAVIESDGNGALMHFKKVSESSPGLEITGFVTRMFRG